MSSLPENAIDSEDQVPAYSLPDPLTDSRGEKITTAAEWPARRQEILALFEEHMYGRVPQAPLEIEFQPRGEDRSALGGRATRKEIVITARRGAAALQMELLLYLPNQVQGPAPLFLGLNFMGNHSVHADPGITLSTRWMPDYGKPAVIDNRATDAARGMAAPRWPVETVIERGFGLASMYYGDIDPDFDDGFQNGVHPLFYAAGQTRPAPHEWGSIAAWAWGLSRALDYLQTDPRVDGGRVAVIGHSRLGKAALWAGATDPRFALVVSNNSGCGGAALSRRRFGESVRLINQRFPHWFCQNFQRYNDREGDLPVDQHMLIALIAPRPVYIASAEEDLWADPRGEFLSGLAAGPVYRLLGAQGLPAQDMPAPEQPLTATVAYHVRRGKHNITPYDWEQYLNFAGRSMTVQP